MVNKVVLIGHPGHDPSLRSTASGPAASFSLATTESYKDKAGARQKRTEWHNVIVWADDSDLPF